MTATPPIASSHAPSVVSSCERDDEKPSAFSTGQSCMLSICYPLYGVPSRSHFPLPTSLLPTSYSPLPTSLLPTSLLPTSHFLLPSYSPLPTSHFPLPTAYVSRLTSYWSAEQVDTLLHTYLLACLLTYLLAYLLTWSAAQVDTLLHNALASAARLGWTTGRHRHHATTDLPLWTIPDSFGWVRQSLDEEVSSKRGR